MTTIRDDSFRRCNMLSRITSESPNFMVIGDGRFLIDENKRVFASAVHGLSTLTVPTGISSFLFVLDGCSFESLIVPDTVNNVPSCYDCANLRSITYPSNVTSIGGFEKCPLIKDVTIPQTCNRFPRLNGCTGLRTLTVRHTTAFNLSNANPFGNTEKDYVGRDTYNTGENKLYVPQGATGYDGKYWLDPLQNSEKCGFTLVEIVE